MVAPKFGDGGGECLRWKRDETQRMLEQHQVADGDSLVRPQRVRVPLEKADMPLGDRRQRTGFVPGGVLAVRPSTPEKRRYVEPAAALNSWIHADPARLVPTNLLLAPRKT